MLPARFRVDPLTVVVLLHHVVNCDDAENDADRTVPELAMEINTFHGTLSRSCFESALYCCNMEDELGRFWHPWRWSFDKFVRHALGTEDFHFDKYYNNIYEKKKKKEVPKGARVDRDPSGDSKHLRKTRSEKE